MQRYVRYWFPAKRYGWGWGFPITWQGWAIFVGFLVLLAVGAAVIPKHSLAGFIAYAFARSVSAGTHGVFPELGVDRLCHQPAGHNRP
jgi:hypothetical protein